MDFGTEKYLGLVMRGDYVVLAGFEYELELDRAINCLLLFFKTWYNEVLGF